MSNFFAMMPNPVSGKMEPAEMLDDYFGPHYYGFRFSPDGMVYKIDSVPKDQRGDYCAPPAGWPGWGMGAMDTDGNLSKAINDDIDEIMSPTIHEHHQGGNQAPVWRANTEWRPSDGFIPELDEDAERAAFEAEFSQSPYEWSFNRHPERGSWPGQYVTYHIETAWQGWLASAKHRRG